VPIAAAFMKKYPSIQIELILGSYLSTLIHDGFDLVIYLKKPPQENIVIREFMSHRMHLCASPKYLKKQGIPKTPEELLKHNCLVYKSLDHTRPWHFIDKTGKKFEVMIRGNFSANSSQALLNAALNDVGIIKLSSHIVNAYLEKGKLVSLLDSYCEKNICIYMARSQSSFVPKKLRLFMDYLLNYFSTGNSAIL
jgi:DNA-binding transcriptional LysR family regulator